MTRSIIDPITRIEGHLRVEMEVDNGVVTDAWVSGGCFRGMELVVQDRTPEDAAQIVQRICGVCPVSHTHASSLAGEAAYGIVIPNQARIIRNLVEGGQFLHSHILWLYTLAALDYVNPLNALNANVGKAYDLMEAAGTSCSTDLKTLMGTLTKFANNGQLSIFSGGWFLDGQAPEAYKLDPEADLICTAHYLEALNMQAKASEICGLIGGKMPHIMTLVPGGTAFVPTEEKLDELYSITREIRDWVDSTMLPDTKIIASAYPEALGFGRGCGRYVAWGVFQRENFEMADRYMPSGVVYTNDGLRLEDPDPAAIKEYVGHSWYVGDSNLNPKEGVTDPLYTEYYVAGTEHEENGHMIGTVNDRYTWSKGPSYNGECMEAGPFSRVLAAYLRGGEKNRYIVNNLDKLMADLNLTLPQLQSTLGRVAARQVECSYIAHLMVDWVDELIEALKGGDSEYFRAPEHLTGYGCGMWEAPRGALYHDEHVDNGRITGYQIIIPTTWNIAPRNAEGVRGPMEQALIGTPVANVDAPINALRTVHSFDPCTACAVHVSEPATGKHFETVTSPWGVR
ncbi:ni Fe-hydrogenase I large subunit [Eggerthella sp. CAG:298]|nr:ni Fe-hydrogenase I large subunit [Eggerthella sp. CAG:298]